MARLIYLRSLHCPSCQTSGQAELSERQASRIESDYDSKVDSVSDGFKTDGKNVFCIRCGNWILV
jgi:hypothetical protein